MEQSAYIENRCLLRKIVFIERKAPGISKALKLKVNRLKLRIADKTAHSRQNCCS